EVLLARVGSHPLKERADLELPPLQIGAEEWRLLLVFKLGRGERLAAATDPQAALPARPQVPHPLGVTAGRDQVPLALVGEQVHRRAAGLAGLATADLEHA